MSYKKQTFANGQILKAGHLNHIEEGISQLSGDIVDVKSDLYKLNEGGLVIKDEVIAKDINNWLDKHPEATTTVQDESLTINKMVVGTLGYVTPEMFGAVGDGANLDTQAIINALNYCTSNKTKLMLNKGKTYCIDSQIELPEKCFIDGNDAVIKAVKNIENCLHLPTNDTQNKNVIKNLIIDGNGFANCGLCSDAQNTRVSDIKIKNCISYGIINNKGDSSFCNVDIHGNYVSNFVGIKDYSDSLYFNITLINCCTAIETTYQSTFIGVHAWMWEKNLLNDSVFCGGNCSGQFIGCYIDTYKKGFKLSNYDSNLLVDACYFYANEEVYNVNNVDGLPTAIFSPETLTSMERLIISNCRFGCVSTNAGFDEDGYYFANFNASFTKMTVSNNLGKKLLNYAPTSAIPITLETDISGNLTISSTNDVVTISGKIYYNEKDVDVPFKVGSIPSIYKAMFTSGALLNAMKFATPYTNYSAYISGADIFIVPKERFGDVLISGSYNRYAYWIE